MPDNTTARLHSDRSLSDSIVQLRQIKPEDTLEDDDSEALDQIYSQQHTTNTTNTAAAAAAAATRPSKLQRLLYWLVTTPIEPPASSAASAEDQHARNYQYWNSTNITFLLGGRLQLHHRPLVPLIVLTLIVLPFVLFCVFDLSFTWRHFHPVMVILVCYFWLLCLVNVIKAAMGDPGVVPRNLHRVEWKEQDADADADTDADAEQEYECPEEYYNVYTLPADDGTDGRRREVTVRYCHTCNTWRMPRTFHCSKCQSCISLHDHHCLWLNNCIGERNFRYFYNFIVFGTLVAMLICACGYYHLFQSWKELEPASRRGMAQSLKANPMSLFVVILTHLEMLYPLVLWAFHTYFLATGQTTREYLRYTDSHLVNPFDSGSCWRNFISRLMKPRGYSLVSKRSKYTANDSRFQRH